GPRARARALRRQAGERDRGRHRDLRDHARGRPQFLRPADVVPPRPEGLMVVTRAPRLWLFLCPAVIPGRREAASPESLIPGGGFGFRAPSLRLGPGMTRA